jgi:Fe-S cluster assembly protein SufD
MKTDISKNNFKELAQSQLEKNLTIKTIVQEKANQMLADLEVPTTKNEEWKYINLNPVLKNEFLWVSSNDLDQKIVDSYKINYDFKNTLVFINGIFSEEESRYNQEIIQVGLNVKSESLLEDALNHHSDFFTVVNVASSTIGYHIEVKENVVLDEAIMVYYFNCPANENIYLNLQNTVKVGKNSSVQLIEKFDGIGKPQTLTNYLVSIVVGEEAQVTHYHLQNENVNNHHIGLTFVEQNEKSTYSNFTVTTNGGVVRNNLYIRSNGSYCETNMYGLGLLKGKSTVDNHTTVDHAQPNSNSNELYKTILDDKSTAIFNGKIYVRQNAQKTNAYQQNRNILLSDDAGVNTKPQLEIWADDVKCSHGATIGSIEKEALFYLRSRGIKERDAKNLLIFAFANEIIEKITVLSVKEYLEKLIFSSLIDN